MEETRKKKHRPIPPPFIPPVKVVQEVEIPQEKPVMKPSDKQESSSTNNRCAWRNSSPVNTTFEVRYFLAKRSICFF